MKLLDWVAVDGCGRVCVRRRHRPGLQPGCVRPLSLGGRNTFSTVVLACHICYTSMCGRRDHQSGSEFGDLIEDSEAVAPADAVTSSSLREQFEAAFALLSEREAAVMRMRFGLVDGQPMTLGKKHGITRERIRQVESNTLS